MSRKKSKKFNILNQINLLKNFGININVKFLQDILPRKRVEFFQGRGGIVFVDEVMPRRRINWNRIKTDFFERRLK